MTPLDKYVMISGKLYTLYRSGKGLLMFKFNNAWVSYEQDRDGPTLDKTAALRECPEWMI